MPSLYSAQSWMLCLTACDRAGGPGRGCSICVPIGGCVKPEINHNSAQVTSRIHRAHRVIAAANTYRVESQTDRLHRERTSDPLWVRLQTMHTRALRECNQAEIRRREALEYGEELERRPPPSPTPARCPRCGCPTNAYELSNRGCCDYCQDTAEAEYIERRVRA